MATAVFLVFLMFVGIVYAVVWYSNIVSVSVVQNVSLSAPTQVSLGAPISFTGTVTGGTTGNTIEIWQCVSETDKTHVGMSPVTTTTLQAGGTFSASWTPTSIGTYYFVAEYTA